MDKKLVIFLMVMVVLFVGITVATMAYLDVDVMVIVQSLFEPMGKACTSGCTV